MAGQMRTLISWTTPAEGDQESPSFETNAVESKDAGQSKAERTLA
jgi:hypothetical protein